VSLAFDPYPIDQPMGNGPKPKLIIPRDYQIEAVQSLFDYFDSFKGNPLVIMPTGTGKSLVIAGFIYRAIQQFPLTRFLCLTHVKKLIDQNEKKLREVWPQAPTGIYSAGLKRRDMDQPIIFGGIQSVKNRVERFGWRDIVIIDECHLVSPTETTTYQYVLAELRAVNPKLKVIGLTATAFRMGLGMLTDKDGGMFTDVAIDLSSRKCWSRFIAEGYLVPPIPHRMKTVIDVGNVGMTKGDYNQGELETAVNTDEITQSIVSEMCQYAHTRHTWLTFCAGIKHAEAMAQCMRERGVTAAAMHTNVHPDELDRIWRAYVGGQLQSITNYGMLTTGVDHPPIDLIGMARHTMSAGLWGQMLGRGTRPCPEIGKRDCVVLDFARNAERLGPIDDLYIPKKKGAANGEVPIKLCDHEDGTGCGAYNHISARICIECGLPFEIKNKLTMKPGTHELITSDMPVVEYFNVHRCSFGKHIKKSNGNESVRVDYFCDHFKVFSEWINFDPGAHNIVVHKTHTWWRQRFNERQVPIPKTNAEALEHLRRYTSRVPTKVRVWTNKRHPELLGVEF
jgi:DNA repair protein RadD